MSLGRTKHLRLYYFYICSGLVLQRLNRAGWFWRSLNIWLYENGFSIWVCLRNIDKCCSLRVKLILMVSERLRKHFLFCLVVCLNHNGSWSLLSVRLFLAVVINVYHTASSNVEECSFEWLFVNSDSRLLCCKRWRPHISSPEHMESHLFSLPFSELTIVILWGFNLSSSFPPIINNI